MRVDALDGAGAWESMSHDAIQLIGDWIARQVPADDDAWFRSQLEKLQREPADQPLYILLGMIPRRLGKADLQLEKTDLAAAAAMVADWDPGRWSLDVAARVAALLVYMRAADGPFSAKFTDLCRTADVGESTALYCGLPLYDDPGTLVNQAIDGLRTNMRSEFEAIAHRNPFPKRHFDNNAWNNMVLKALFIGVMLEPIQGLDERANPELAQILIDYAHERWAAGRPVQPELWRCVGPFATEAFLTDIERVIDTGNAVERRAAALALHASPPSNAADRLRDKIDDDVEEISSGRLTWSVIAQEMLDNALAITRKMNKEVELKQ